jgi:hypothetical protein
VVEAGEGARFAGEASGKVGHPFDRGQNFQGNDAIESALPGPVNCAHASVPEQFKNLELWKMRGKGFGFGWYESSGPGPAGSGRQACFHQALRTEALRGISGQMSAATGANANGIHRQMFFLTPATEAISGKGYITIFDLGFTIYGRRAVPPLNAGRVQEKIPPLNAAGPAQRASPTP